MDENTKKEENFIRLRVPSAAELSEMKYSQADMELAKKAGLHNENGFSERYAVIATVYRYIISRYLCSELEIEEIEKKLRDRNYCFLKTEEKKSFYQKYDKSGTDYFYLRNDVHVERLDENALSIIEEAYTDGSDEKLEAAAKVVVDSWKNVLAFIPGCEYSIELFPTIHGEGIVPANALVYMLHTEANYDENGAIVDWDEDRKRLNVVYGLKSQLEKLWSEDIEIPVKVIVE